MQLEFSKQQVPDSISTGDEIELYNCEDHHQNGHYTVVIVEPETGDVTLAGKGRLSGVLTVIYLG